MNEPLKHCAILTMDCLDNFEVSDDLLIDPLKQLGWQISMVSWRQQKVDWDQFQAVIIRSPWDYQDDAEAFLQVLTQIEASSAQLENSLSVVKWNIDKGYLQELADNKIAIVPTIWGTSFSEAILDSAFRQFNTEHLVIKPRISANADNTFCLRKDNYQSLIKQLSAVFKEKCFMLQPFMDNIVSEGEYSLFYFNGEYSHAILKTPKKDDFRVQEEHGGSLQAIIPEVHLKQCADAVIAVTASIHNTPLYARVDFVRSDDSFVLMEAELIEPSLYFNMDELSAQRFATAFNEKMKCIHA